MISISVTRRDDGQSSISVEPGGTLMEALRDNGIDDILAICGGCCACATCHVYIEDGRDELKAPASEDENDLLDTSEYRQEQSRLSCQITLTPEDDGLKVRVAPED